MYKSVGEVIHSLISQSGLHGIPRILSSKHWYQRVLWLCLVLVTCGFLLHQLYQLSCNYNSYPIKTKVSMKRTALRFPSVSFCNLNPVKTTKMPNIFGTDLYYHILRISDQSGIFNPDMFKNFSGNNDVYGNDMDKGTFDLYGNYFYDQTAIGGDGISNLNNGTDDPLKQIIDHYDTNSNTLAQLAKFLEYVNSQITWKNDPRSEDVKRFKILFQNESKSTRKAIGHSIDDLLIECSFNGKQCSAENFTLFQSLDYGNCYTLDSDLFMARKAGHMYGLQIVLQVEKFEQAENFLDGSGVRLVIHEPGTIPFPEEEGFTLSPGYETSIGMKMVHLTRTLPPHGRCDDGQQFYQTYGVRYSMSTCLHICRNLKVLDICKCRPSENLVDIPYMDQFSSLPVCSLAAEGVYDETKIHMMACEHYVYYQLEENSIKCDCESACRKTVYRHTLSGRVWPKETYLKEELLNLACSGRNFSYCAHRPLAYSPLANIDMDYFKDNFLKMVVYYEDLNFEDISEEPLYDEYRFLADIGGTLGLFLGASLLSFVELFELLVEILNHFRHKCLKNRIAAVEKKKTRSLVKPCQKSKVKKRVPTASKIPSEIV